MAKARALFGSIAWDSTTTHTESAGSLTGFPVTNLFNDERTRPWMSASTNGVHSVESVFTSTTLYGVTLVDAAWGAGDTIKLEYYDGSYHNWGGGSGLFTISGTSGTISLWNTSGYAGVTKIRVTFSAGGATRSVQIGVLMIGGTAAYFAATVNVTDELPIEPFDRSDNRETIGGQIRSNLKRHGYQGTCPFSFVAQAQRDALWAGFAILGTAKPFLLAIDPDDQTLVFYAYLTGLPGKHQTRNQWSLSVSWKEAA